MIIDDISNYWGYQPTNTGILVENAHLGHSPKPYFPQPPAVPWPGLNGAGAPWFAHEPRHQDAAG